LKQKTLPPFSWLILPLLGVIASYYGDRQLLLAVFLIAALMVFSVIGVPEEPTGKKYDHHVMMLVLSISLTLLMMQAVSSSYLQGGDIHQEYNDFSQVLATGFSQLSISQGTLYNNVLSVTVLPAVLKIVSGLDGTVIFTIVFPLLFSITPVLLYKLCRMFLGPTESFFAAFLFLAYHDFYVILIAEARQEIAEILLLLLLLLISTKLAKGWGNSVSIILLTVGLVAAHYTIAYVYLFLLVFWYLMGLVFPRTKVVTSEQMGLTLSLTLFWLAILFATGNGGITSLAQFISSFNSTGFFSPASRPTVIAQALGVNVLSTPLHLLNRMTYYLVNAALGLGFLAALFKREKTVAERKILPVLAFGMLLIGAYVVVPNFGFGLGVGREYHIGLLLASPCFVYGIIFLTSIIRRLFSALTHLPLRVPATRSITNWRLAAATLLVLFLIFDSGWVWAVSLDNPTSLLLDTERMLHIPGGPATYYGHYLSSEDVAGARWLRQLGFVSALCADYLTRNNVLTSYGGFSRGNLSIEIAFLPDTSRCDFPGGGYVFLSALNTVYGIGISSNVSSTPWRISQISSELMSYNMIYSNGATTIYTRPG
jgi:uncharacterized membrane protein